METGSFLLRNLSRTPWAIHPDKLCTIAEVIKHKIEDEKLVKLTQANSAGRKVDPIKGYETIGTKAIIPIYGTMMQRCSWLDAASGFVSMGALEDAIKAARADNMIRHIILDWDCPGGTVSGTEQLSNLVMETRQYKRITSLINSEMCSGALWVGTAADEVYSTAQANVVGSLGVYIAHTEYKNDKVKVTYIKAGKYKAAGNPYEPLAEDALEQFQHLVDNDYALFIDAVARNRGTDADFVLDNWADAQLFHAFEAVENGLIDGIVSLDQLLAEED